MRLDVYKPNSSVARFLRYRSYQAVPFILLLLVVYGQVQSEPLRIHYRTQRKDRNEQGFSCWKQVETVRKIEPEKSVIIVCDMWEEKGCRGHVERIAEMAPMVNEMVVSARARGMHIIMAPSDITDFYIDAPARKRIKALPNVPMPEEREHINPPIPVETSGSCDSEPHFGNVERQHPAIVIDQDKDVISSDKQEIWNYLHHHNIEHVFILGVHTNMCILNRPFAIQQMVKWGVDIALVRDATDASYHPYLWPYVDHETGTRLVVEYIEKFWCPSVSLEELTSMKAISFAPWKTKRPPITAPAENIARSVGPIYKKAAVKLRFTGTTQVKSLDAKKLFIWESEQLPMVFLADKTALIIQDMWDRTRHAENMKRIDQLAPILNSFLPVMRKLGIRIIHAPAGSMTAYEHVPARKRMTSLPRKSLPKSVFLDGCYKYLLWLYRASYDPKVNESTVVEPPLPFHAVSRCAKAGSEDRDAAHQHHAIEIDQEHDYISDDRQQVWNLFAKEHIEYVIVVGFLTGESILDGAVGVKQLSGWGLNAVVLSDLTITDCDLDQPPYVNYEVGKAILDGYLEKFWCCTAKSDELLSCSGN